jgi:hypothetical protein
MERQVESSGGWACDAKYTQPGDKGCLSYCSSYRQMKYIPNWRCSSCDFDICLKCCIYQNKFNDINHLFTKDEQDKFIMFWMTEDRDIKFFTFDS